MAIPWINPRSGYNYSAVSAGDTILATHPNNLFTDIQETNPPEPKINLARLGAISPAHTTPLYWQDRFAMVANQEAATPDNILFWDARSGGNYQREAISVAWADADTCQGLVHLGVYIYALLYDSGGPAYRIYRYNDTDLTTSAQMTVTLGTTSGARLYSDGTDLYVNQDGANTTASLHVFERFSISGTTLTSQGTTTCGSTSTDFSEAVVDGAGNFYGNDGSDILRRFNSSGTLQATLGYDHTATGATLIAIEGIPYIREGSEDIFAIMALLP